MHYYFVYTQQRRIYNIVEYLTAFLQNSGVSVSVFDVGIVIRYYCKKLSSLQCLLRTTSAISQV